MSSMHANINTHTAGWERDVEGRGGGGGGGGVGLYEHS